MNPGYPCMAMALLLLTPGCRVFIDCDPEAFGEQDGGAAGGATGGGAGSGEPGDGGQSGFVCDANEYVKHPELNLLWLRCPVGQQWNGPSCSCSGDMTTSDWEGAKTACPEGYRVPSRDEYVALLGGGCGATGQMAFDGDCNSCESSAFCSTMFEVDTGTYWSADGLYNNDFGYYANLDRGSVNIDDKSEKYPVRCVRPGTPGAPVLCDAEESVTQPNSGLVWLRCPLGQTWDGESCTCTGTPIAFNTAEMSGESECPVDYRYPTRDEFFSLLGGNCGPDVYDLTFSCEPCSEPSDCTAMFGADTGVYWSSTRNAGDPRFNYDVVSGLLIADFGSGKVKTFTSDYDPESSGDISVRCVTDP